MGDKSGLQEGSAYVIWLKRWEETVIRKIYRDGEFVRLETLDSNAIKREPIYVEPRDMEIRAKLITRLAYWS